MKPKLCPICGVNLALVGRIHRCVPQQAATAPEPMPVIPSSPLRPSPNASSPNTPSPNGAYARNGRWRDKNRDRYNASMRDFMRQKRATEKTATAS
jgi:hypothetical protein